MNKLFKTISKPFQLINSVGKGIDKTIKTAEKGYKYMQLVQSFIKHLKAFNEDRKRILGVQEIENVELKTKTNVTV